MVYHSHSGPGHVGYSQGNAGPNEAYFEGHDDESPFSHYQDNDYKNSPSSDYQKNDSDEGHDNSSENNDGHEETITDAIKKEEQKSNNGSGSFNVHKKAAEELVHEHFKSNAQDIPKKKAKDIKSIEEAIMEASKEKKEVFILK